MLTRECKKDFEKWFEKVFSHNPNDESKINVQPFNEMGLVWKYGVYVDFFDSVDIRIKTKHDWYHSEDNYAFTSYVDNQVFSEPYNTRHEARTEAIKKANQIYNEKHSN